MTTLQLQLQHSAMSSLFLLAVALAVTIVSAADEWGYEAGKNGPEHWPEVNVEPAINECGSSLQSPIDISPTESIYIRPQPSLQYHGYKSELDNVTAKIEHHSAYILNVDNGDRFISGGPLNGTYRANSFHYHWGRRLDTGSEHTIDGKRYAIELHIVHIKAEYASLEEARSHPDGICVLAVLFDVLDNCDRGEPPFWNSSPGGGGRFGRGERPRPEGRLTEYFTQLDGIEELTIWQSGISLFDLLPKNRYDYFTYKGSLTTPPCSEAVTWIIFAQQVPLPTKVLSRFHWLKDSTGMPIPRNWRPIQRLNERDVYRTFQIAEDTQPNVYFTSSDYGEQQQQPNLAQPTNDY